ncbi:MAG: DUF882 domain-containing protein [Xanthobacteraceae bacterium]
MGKRTFYSCGLAALVLLVGSRGLQNAIAEGDTRTISLHHIHTNEDITITFKREGRYDEAALDKLNRFLRDWRREQQIRMDPHLIDLVWEVQRETGSKEPIWVVCGYRSPETNAMLRRRSDGVAKYSQHMLGHAMDFYIPGVPLEQLRVIGLRLQRGGVGFYPTSGSPFVHMDTGGVRHWPRMTREQLVRVFPDGRTVHIPTDGRPLPGYELALADLRKRGDNPSEMSIEAARSAGVQVADGGMANRIVSPFKKFFGLGRDEEDDDAGGSAPAVMASSEPASNAEPLRLRAKAAVVAAIDRAEDKVSAQKVKLIQVASRAEDKVSAQKVKLIQAASRAEEKLAADKTKIARAASKVHVISRAEAAPAVLTPSQIIIARGFWQGLPDGMTAARPAATNPLAALPRGTISEPETTGSIGSFAAERTPPAGALAYAEPGAQEAPLNGGTVPAAMNGAPRVTVTNAVAVQTGNNEMTVAVKRVNGRPASAILTVANKMSASLADSERLNDPWLRAIVLSPSVTRFLSVTTLGVHDFRFLAALIAKPANSVMMTFAADPQPGLAQDHFSGSAIVFVSTVIYPIQTADLR